MTDAGFDVSTHGQSLRVLWSCKHDPNLLVFQLKDNSVSTLKSV